MGWNAGGFGQMTFPNASALEAWKQTTVRHADWDDWINELEGAYEPEEPVADRLADIAKKHDPKSYRMQELTLSGLDVSLLYDTGEDGFRDGAGDFAALLRCAEAHGAKGKFFFLGTAGAEGDFVYELSLNGPKPSGLKELSRAAGAKVYESEGYAAFNARLSELFENANPEFKARMQRVRQGSPISADVQGSHLLVMSALAAFSDDVLAKTARKFPAMVPDGKKPVMATQLFKATGQVRQQLMNATAPEISAVALWCLGELSVHFGVSCALSAYESTSSEPYRAAAMRVFGRAGDEPKHRNFDATHAQRAMQHVVNALVDGVPMLVEFAAVDALRALKLPALEAELRGALQRLAAQPRAKGTGGVHLVENVAARKLKSLAPQLTALALSSADLQQRMAAATALVAMKDEAGMRALLPKLSEQYGVGLQAAHAMLAVDPAGALALLQQVGKVKRSPKDYAAHHLLQVLEEELRLQKKKARAAKDTAWVEACLALTGHGDHYVTYNALAVLKLAPRSPAAVEKLEALLLSGVAQQIQVIEALQGQGSKNLKALIKQRLKVTKNANERTALQLFS